MKTKKRIILRANGTTLIGFGHLYRLMALANMLQEDFYLIFAIFKTNDFIEKEIRNCCDEVIVLPGELPYKTSDEIKPTDEIIFDIGRIIQKGDIVVLDGYYFGAAYQKAAKEKGCKVVSIDDLAVNHFFSDIVINHAPGINERIYIREPYTKLCLGIDHAIIRAPFLQIPPSSKRSIGHVFISLGGSDYFKITERIVTLLNDHDLFTGLHIMCSSSFPEDMMASLEDLSNSSSGKVNLYKNLSSEQIVALMDSCQYAIVSASTVLLEAYSRGLICFAGYYTNNQILIYDGFIKEKKAIGLGDLRKADISVIDDAYKNAGQLQLIPVRSYKNLKQIFLSLADA